MVQPTFRREALILVHFLSVKPHIALSQELKCVFHAKVATDSRAILPLIPRQSGSWPLLVMVEREITVAAHGRHVQEVKCLVQAIVSHACTDARRPDEAT